jgi:hypothetical protein
MSAMPGAFIFEEEFHAKAQRRVKASDATEEFNPPLRLCDLCAFAWKILVFAAGERKLL